jgi:heme/copper-type cytochrome/quinol oxidase subunit 4
MRLRDMTTTTREASKTEADREERPGRTRRSRVRHDSTDRADDVTTDATDDATVARSEGRNRPRAATWLASAGGGLARIVRLAAGVIAAIIVAGILLVVLKANPTNSVVSTVHDMARGLVGPFDGMFKLDDAKTAVAVNWGIAAFVYLIVGALIARFIWVIGTAGLRRHAV